MAVLALAAIVLAVAGLSAIVIAARHQRKPAELRGDWWTPFEREFRAYVRQQSKSVHRDRDRRRHRGERA
jgi:hypothetical protein